MGCTSSAPLNTSPAPQAHINAPKTLRTPDLLPNETRNATLRPMDLARISNIDTLFLEYGHYVTKRLIMAKHFRPNISPAEVAAREAIPEPDPPIWFEPKTDILYFANTQTLKLFLGEFRKELPTLNVRRIAVGFLRSHDGATICGTHEDNWHGIIILQRMAKAIQVATRQWPEVWRGREDLSLREDGLDITWATKDELMRDHL
ncbi:hypothetical protein BDZ45DRAFT_745472 [Acephala macrosclerotiorum]|nr:hypothetical protein BDZ45DRAFT_745472 [Acephala macrosclerotiorum]